MDRVEGQVPPESPVGYHSAGWVFDATPDQRRQMWLSTLDAMSRLHRVEVEPHFSYLAEPRWGMSFDSDPAAERLRQWRKFTIWACASDGEEPSATLMHAFDYLEKKLPPRPDRLSIHWGDGKLGNLMYRDFSVVAIFDWELCGLSAAEEDFMNVIALDDMLGRMRGLQRLQGFLSNEESIAAYQGMLGRRLVGPNWWYAFVLVRVAAIMHRMTLQRRAAGDLPPDADLEEANGAMPLVHESLAAL
jgi:aminoglycoside phosphotransferase (APT) family kinase protein